jgi:hypothetical protein
MDSCLRVLEILWSIVSTSYPAGIPAVTTTPSKPPLINVIGTLDRFAFGLRGCLTSGGSYTTSPAQHIDTSTFEQDIASWLSPGVHTRSGVSIKYS